MQIHEQRAVSGKMFNMSTTKMSLNVSVRNTSLSLANTTKVFYSTLEEKHSFISFHTFMLMYCIVTNTSIVTVIHRKSRFHTPHFLLIVFYSLTDIVFCANDSTNKLILLTHKMDSPMWFCQSASFLSSTALLASIHLLGLISFERWIFFCKPYHYLHRMSLLNITLITVGIYALAFLILGTMEINYPRNNIQTISLRCVSKDSNIWMNVLFFGFYLLPSGSMTVFSLVKLFQVAKKSQAVAPEHGLQSRSQQVVSWTNDHQNGRDHQKDQAIISSGIDKNLNGITVHSGSRKPPKRSNAISPCDKDEAEINHQIPALSDTVQTRSCTNNLPQCHTTCQECYVPLQLRQESIAPTDDAPDPIPQHNYHPQVNLQGTEHLTRDAIQRHPRNGSSSSSQSIASVKVVHPQVQDVMYSHPNCTSGQIAMSDLLQPSPQSVFTEKNTLTNPQPASSMFKPQPISVLKLNGIVAKIPISYKRVLKMILIVSGVFWLTFIPGFVISTWILASGITYDDMDARVTVSVYLRTTQQISNFIFYDLSKLLNPLVIFYTHPQLRKELRKYMGQSVNTDPDEN